MKKDERTLYNDKKIIQDFLLINIYTPNIGAPKYISDLKEETDRNTILVGDFNTPLASMENLLDRIRQQKYK